MEWISVKEGLPEDMPENKEKKVIPCFVALKSVYPNGKHTIQKRQRQIVSAYDKNGKRIKTWAWSRRRAYDITHWMPLPAPPKEG